MKRLIILQPMIISVLILFGCSEEKTNLVGPSRVFDEIDSIHVNVGSSYTISKSAAFSAGCRWEFERGFDERYIELEKYSIVCTDPDKDGAPFIQKWEYSTKKRGTIYCTMKYSCVWQEKPSSIIIIVVIIE